jgi:hypothetical protein
MAESDRIGSIGYFSLEVLFVRKICGSNPRFKIAVSSWWRADRFLPKFENLKMGKIYTVTLS